MLASYLKNQLLKQVATATDDLKRNYLLSCIGPSGYKYLKSFCLPDAPATKTYADLVKLLKDHLAPRLKAISEQYKFGLLQQDSGETLSSYMARVKEAGSTCMWFWQPL